MNDLLRQLILIDRRLLEMSAKLIARPDDQAELKTQIQFQLTPQSARSGEKPIWPIRASLQCHGSNALSGDEMREVFAVGCTLQLSYQQVVGAALTLEEVKQAHMSLSRQAYPMLVDKCQALIQQLGLAQVRLPMDMLQVASQPASPADAVH